MILKFFTFLIFSTTGYSALATCLPTPIIGGKISVLGKSINVQLINQDNVDTIAQSSITQSFALISSKTALTEEQVRETINQLHSNAKQICHKRTLTGIRIFLYSSIATAVGSNWIGRLNNDKNQITVDIDIREKIAATGKQSDLRACIAGTAAGLSFDPYPKLPALPKRKIIGTWAGNDRETTVSLEEVYGKSYWVIRDEYCSSGTTGEPLRKLKNGRYYRLNNAAGDYYLILPSGELGVYDKDGVIEVRSVHAGLFAPT